MSLNKALLGKWKCVFCRNRIQLGLRSSSPSMDGNQNFRKAFTWWKDIKKACGEKRQHGWFDENIIRKIGNESKVSF